MLTRTQRGTSSSNMLNRAFLVMLMLLQYGFVVSFTKSVNLLTLPKNKGRHICSPVCQSMAAPSANSGRSGALMTSKQTSVLSKGWWWTAGVGTCVAWFACAHQALCTYKPWRVRHNAIGLAQALAMLPLQWAVFDALIGSTSAKKYKAASSVELLAEQRKGNTSAALPVAGSKLLEDRQDDENVNENENVAVEEIIARQRLTLGLAVASMWCGTAVMWSEAFTSATVRTADPVKYHPCLRSGAAATHLLTAVLCLVEW